jgi:hypothetical protein
MFNRSGGSGLTLFGVSLQPGALTRSISAANIPTSWYVRASADAEFPHPER